MVRNPLTIVVLATAVGIAAAAEPPSRAGTKKAATDPAATRAETAEPGDATRHSASPASPVQNGKLPLAKIPARVKANFHNKRLGEHVLVDSGYRIWGLSVIRTGDGKYHGYYARWPQELAHGAWLTDCEIAHAVADRPEGPFRHVNVVLESRNPKGWDIVNSHNPAVCLAEGKICLYYISNQLRGKFGEDDATADGFPKGEWLKSNRKLVRNSQRIGVAIATDPAGPFVRAEDPVIVPDGELFQRIAVNPAVAYVDGTYTMIMKGDHPDKEAWFRIQLVGHAERPRGPFAFSTEPVYDKAQTEDAGIWYDHRENRYYMACHVMGKRELALFTSSDSHQWRPANPMLFTKKEFRLDDGAVWAPDRFERPFVLTGDDGRPVMLYVAVADRDVNGNIAVPFESRSSNPQTTLEE